ncbi:MAG TPA: peptide MFS transporter [Thermoanaerobaculia bacterium]|nr:peptide MFS transporter [Thermoanaerobaculia bacterium]
MATATTTTTEKHPKGLYVLFGSEMWERYSFYTVNAMLALYLRDTVQGFGFTAAEATGVSATYLAAVYGSPLIGGLIADLFLGFRRSIIVGALFFIAGHALLGIPGSINVVYAALACLVIGNGFFKPNVSSMVGNLYAEGSHLKDKAYLIFYMGINIGATLAPLVAGFVRPRFGFHPAFALGAVGMIISLIVFLLGTKHVRHADRIRGKSDFSRSNGSKANQEAVATSEDLPPVVNESARVMDAVPEWKRIMALIVVFLIVIVFWMIFHQNSLTLTFWAEDHTRWTFIEAGGILSNAINPLYIIILSLPLAAFWTWLDKRGKEPSTPTKMMFGMTLTGLSMLVLYFASVSNGFTAPAFRVLKVDGGQTYVRIAKEARDYLKITAPPTQIEVLEEGKPVQVEAWPVTVNGGAVQPNDFVRLESHTATGIVTSPTTKASLWWLLLLYLIISLGELMLSPMGLSLVSKVAPIRWRGLMMGGWFLATAIGNALTAIGVYWDRWSHAQFFLVLAMMAFGMAVVLFLLLRPLKKAMPGV